MLNRRGFIQAAALAFPLAGCTSRPAPGEPQIGNLTPEQMETARTSARDFEKLLESIRKAEVPYSLEPHFYPSL
ncbi:MAG TPA: hypothetical protein VE422_21280 [Terriglobia bacterium]|nr:hypothetical protein [Terriglobia bacterium]